MRLLLPAVAALLAGVSSALGAQCSCPPPAEETAQTIGVERMRFGDSDFGVTMFAFHHAQLPRNDVGPEFSLSLGFAPYPILVLEAGPLINVAAGPVSLLARFGIGALALPTPFPEGYAGVGLLVRISDQWAFRADAMRRYFNAASEWQPFDSIGFGLTALTSGGPR